LEKGADVNLCQGTKDLPINMAITRQNEKLVELILRYNPNLTKPNFYKTYPLNLACRNEC